MKRREFLTATAAASTISTAAHTFVSAQATPDPATPNGAIPEPQTGYAPVNGLEMYYEIHGAGGTPLLLLHGAFANIDRNWGQLLPLLAENRRIVAVESQGHGRTADIDRPITYEQMADDAAALLAYLEIERADVFGYSMGGSTALQVAIRHPQRLRKLVAASATFNSDGVYPGILENVDLLTAEALAGTSIEEEYLRLAPNPEDFPILVDKIRQLEATPQDWPPEDIEGIAAPTQVIIGDSDLVRPEHAVKMFRLLGGGVFGDFAGLPDSQLAVLPGTTHVGVVMQTDLLLAIIPPFLDAPMPEGQ